jgi:FkbM family methyltransferase
MTKMLTFTTPYGVLACRPDFDGKAIAHMKEHSAFMESDLALMRAFISPDDEIIDVGANIGGFTVPFSKYARKVHAFEPIPETADQLDYNLAQNGVTNVVVHRVGLSDTTGVLYPHRAPDAGSTSLGAKQVSQSDETVPVTTLDDCFGSTKISFMKIDVEGMEVSVLRGGKKFIAASRPVIFFEIQKGNMEAYGTSFAALARLFPRYAFYFNLRLPQDGTYRLGRLPWLGFLRFGSGTRNVLAVPKEYGRKFPHTGRIITFLTLVARKVAHRMTRYIV